MEQVLSVINFLVLNGPVILSAIIGIISGVIAISLLIKGPEPERTLQKLLDLLSKFSRK